MKEYVINAKNMEEKELNRIIKKQAMYHDKLIINHPESKHNLCAGLIEDIDIEINGSAGYFVGTMINGAKIHINGNAGWFAGDNMTKEELVCPNAPKITIFPANKRIPYINVLQDDDSSYSEEEKEKPVNKISEHKKDIDDSYEEDSFDSD